MNSTPSQAILELGEEFYDPVTAAVFPQKIPRFLNFEKAQTLNLDLKNPQDWIRHFAEFHPLPNNLKKPLALRYHGHQFRHYNPDLGDGRGFLWAQFESESKLLDLGTKGSGQTPYSRAGDGRLTLKGAFREALATEMLESLGVNTSKTFCFFETDEELIRSDEPSPTRSAVLTRLSHSHIRFGTFQRLAYLQQPENIKKLYEYCRRHFYPETDSVENFLHEVTARTARLTSQWMMAGFVHGVLNTDNMNITGESFDYGPYRFLPTYDPTFTAAYFDQSGLYCFGRQPHTVFWNLQQLGLSLQVGFPEINLPVALKDFESTFINELEMGFLRRLNLQAHPDLETQNLIGLFFQSLEKTAVPFDQAFFDFFGGLENGRWTQSVYAPLYHSEFSAFTDVLKSYPVQQSELLNHSYFKNSQPCTLLIEEIESIWRDISEKDNWSAFESKIAQIRKFRGIFSG